MKNIKRWRRSHRGIPTEVGITETDSDFVVSMLGSPITIKKYKSLEEAKEGGDSQIKELHPSHSCEKSKCGDWRESVAGVEKT